MNIHPQVVVRCIYCNHCLTLRERDDLMATEYKEIDSVALCCNNPYYMYDGY